MATYNAKIPERVSARTVFEAVNEEAVGGMEGIIVSAHGDHRTGEVFSVEHDVVFKACVRWEEIVERIGSGSLVGRLNIENEGVEIVLSRMARKVRENDATVPEFNSYEVMMTLRDYPAIKDEARILADYEGWKIAPLSGFAERAHTVIYGETKDVCFRYLLRVDAVADFLAVLREKLSGIPKRIYGEVQEREAFREFEVDLERHGFRGNYSVYPDWPVPTLSNYPRGDYVRFCDAIDARRKSVFVSVGRGYVAYRASDGRITRSLRGNHFEIYGTKTGRSLCIGFEQYDDGDIPVRQFSRGIRKRLKGLGVVI